jgi:hypothetical protein
MWSGWSVIVAVGLELPQVQGGAVPPTIASRQGMLYILFSTSSHQSLTAVVLMIRVHDCK